MFSYKELSKKINIPCDDENSFCINGLNWLCDHYKDIHLEYHKDCGWQISTCYEQSSWSGWVGGESLLEVIKAGIELTKIPLNFHIGKKYTYYNQYNPENSVTVVYTGGNSGVVVGGNMYEMGKYITGFTFDIQPEMWRETN